MVEDTTPVASLVAVTVTPGIRAPEASERVPPMVALLDWASADTGTTRDKRNMSVTNVAFIGSSFSYSLSAKRGLHSEACDRAVFSPPKTQDKWTAVKQHRSLRTSLLSDDI